MGGACFRPKIRSGSKYKERNSKSQAATPEKAKADNTQDIFGENNQKPPQSTQMAWCSIYLNTITIYDTRTATEFPAFLGAQPPTACSFDWSGWSHVNGIPSTNFLLSVYHWPRQQFAELKIFEISKTNANNSKLLYKFTVHSEDMGAGDVAIQRNNRMAALLPVREKTAYHVFDIDNMSLCRITKWHQQHKEVIEGIDFDPQDSKIATIDRNAVCLVSDFFSNECLFYLDLSAETTSDWYNRCRWNPIADIPTLFAKCNRNKLNIIDAEKQKTILKDPFLLLISANENPNIYWIDCHYEGNLVAAGASDGTIRVYDSRQNTIVRHFKIHKEFVRTVKWDASGDRIATACFDNTAKLVDFATGKVLLSGITADNIIGAEGHSDAEC